MCLKLQWMPLMEDQGQVDRTTCTCEIDPLNQLVDCFVTN